MGMAGQAYDASLPATGPVQRRDSAPGHRLPQDSLQGLGLGSAWIADIDFVMLAAAGEPVLISEGHPLRQAAGPVGVRPYVHNLDAQPFPEAKMVERGTRPFFAMLPFGPSLSPIARSTVRTRLSWRGDSWAKTSVNFAGVAPTGKEVSVPFCILSEVEGSKIRQARVYFELPALMAQLGAGPGM